MLNAHPDIAFTPETHFIRRYLAVSDNLNESILEDEYLNRLGVDIGDIYSRALSNSDFYRLLLEGYSNKTYIGDKDPKNVESLKTIKKYYPDAFIIHIYRDPRAVISSRMKAKWSKDKPLWQHILAYKAQYNYAEITGRRLFADHYMSLSYESLTEDAEGELRLISSFIGAKYKSEMLEFYKTSDEVVVGDEISWKKKLFEPVDKKNNDKWRNHLTYSQANFITWSLGSEVKRLNYDILGRFHVLPAIFSFLSWLYCFRNCK